MAWMTVEAAVAVASGIVAGSIALIGFRLDSAIEFFAAAVVVWQLREGGDERESRAVRLIGVTFFVLAVYLAAASIRDLISQARPGQPVAGLVVTAAALVVMPSLAVAKHRTGTALDNQALTADAAESAFCAFTSGAALLGVGLNAWLGWWWADPAAAVLDEALRPVEPGGTGQIARSGHVPLGYYGDEAATRATFPVIDGGRWALLGDMAEVDRDGSIIVLGRGSMCVNTGGEKVYPEEVEQALTAHPAVIDAVVAGIPDERFGERVAAVVSLRPGTGAGADALREHCRGTLAGYKVLARIRFVAEVRHSPTGKADYR
jgi:acyl-CoA synthetase (AMP-forming)/AMP-acid ligase II